MLRWVFILCSLAIVSASHGQVAPAESVPPPPPTNLPTVRVVPPHSSRVRTVPSSPLGAPTRAKRPIPAAYRPLTNGVLAWNGEKQESTVRFGTAQSTMSFAVTNVSPEAVTITAVRTSCGCTVPKLPPMPWKLEPGTNGTIGVTMNLAGKRGKVIKTVTVTTDQGFKTLYVQTTIEEAPAGVMGESDRLRNLRIASANRQAVFQGNCITCHVTPALNKMGAELYDTACGICHEAEHRASMVPDLANLQKETNADYWRTWITSSMDGKLMPAFALEHGGFLNATQIDSLVQHVLQKFPEQQTAASAPGPAPATH